MLTLTTITLLATCSLAQPALSAHPQQETQTAFLEASGEARLAPSLETVDAQGISTDLHFLASDELQGRDSPSEGLRVAARYIRSRLQRLKFEPGAAEGYFYEYSLPYVSIREPDSHAKVELTEGPRRLEPGVDYFFHPYTLRNGEASGEVVFCGRGETSDFTEAEVSDRWALVYDSDLRWRKRQMDAAQAGAVGLLIMPAPDYEGEPYSAKYGHWMERMREKRISRGRRPSGRSLQTNYVTQAVAQMLFGAEEAPPVGTLLPVRFHEERHVTGGDDKITLENVCGFWPGQDPELSREVIIISAHYDHVGVGSDGEVYNGADDNGSGTCSLLALADALKAYGPMSRSVLLMWVSAEEKGLLGSKAWCKDPWLPEGCSPIANVNIDMIGRNAPDQLLITPTQERPEYNGLVRLAERAAPLEGFPQLKSCDDYWGRSDHKNFANILNIPVAFLFSDVHEDYHQPSDTPDKVDCDKIRRATRLVLRMLDGMQDPDMDLNAESFPR